MDMRNLICATNLTKTALETLRSDPNFKEIFISECLEDEDGTKHMIPITYFWPKRRCSDEHLCLDPMLLEMRREQAIEDERIKQMEDEWDEEASESDE